MKPSSKFLTALRRLLLGAALASTVIALFVTIENWRGDRAWAEVEGELTSRGELPSVPEIPPLIPDDQNFFKTPLLSRLLYRRPDDFERRKLLAETQLKEIRDWPNLGPRSSDSGRARPFLSRDFPAIRRIFRQRGFIAAPDSDSPVADLLLALEPLRPLLDEVRDAATARPKAALNVEIVSPTSQNVIVSPTSLWSVDFSIFEGLGMALAVRADLELELGQVSEASADILALLRLGNELAAPTASATWVSLTNGVSLHGIATAIITRGLERQLWNESQLTAIDRLLGQLRPLPTARAATRHERAIILSFMDARPSQNPENFYWPFWFFHGWAQQNKVTYSRAIDRDLLGSMTVAPDRIFPRPPQIRRARPDGRPKRLVDEVYWLLAGWATKGWAKTERLRHPYSWLSESVFHPDQLLQGLGSRIDRLALFRISCAFERHRLAVGTSPEKLDDLVPRFLPAVPTGIFDGQPLQLRKTPEGGSEIYFFGRDARDNQGTGDDLSLKIPAR